MNRNFAENSNFYEGRILCQKSTYIFDDRLSLSANIVGTKDFLYLPNRKSKAHFEVN